MVMENYIPPSEARAALDTIERSRRRVIDAIDLPSWYWWGLALGWIALGVMADVGPAWLSSVATFAFGTAHASVAPRVISGRHASRNLSVHPAIAPTHLARTVIGSLVALGAVTVGVALLARADGADHPVTMASVLVAVIILLGGPLLVAMARGQAAHAGQ
jgi:hypothetical protein